MYFYFQNFLGLTFFKTYSIFIGLTFKKRASITQDISVLAQHVVFIDFLFNSKLIDKLDSFCFFNCHQIGIHKTKETPKNQLKILYNPHKLQKIIFTETKVVLSLCTKSSPKRSFRNLIGREFKTRVVPKAQEQIELDQEMKPLDELINIIVNAST